MASQTERILAEVQKLIAEHDRWENDPAAPDVPSQALDDAVTDCIIAISEQSIPQDCRTLVNCLMDFSDLWLDYRGGEWDQQGRPHSKVWNAFTEVKRAVEAILRTEPRRIESVSQLRDQKVSDLLIAKAYGSRNPATGEWEGIFFNAFGQVKHDLIEQQCRHENGQGEPVIPGDWVHPQHRPQADDSMSRLQRKMQAIQARAGELPRHDAADAPIQDKGTPESMALEGGFPHQVKKAFHLTDAEVEAVFAKIGKPLESSNTLPELPNQPEPDHHSDPADSHTGEYDETAYIVLEIHASDDSLGPADIARKLESDYGHKINWQQVASILRRQREGAAA